MLQPARRPEAQQRGDSICYSMEPTLPSASAEQAAPFVSVIIPALNEEKHIERLLQALQAQTVPQGRFEVLLIDNGSTDKTLEKASAFQGLLPLALLSRQNCTISALRNAGAASARGKVLAFLDADCIPRPNWLERSLERASDDDLWGAHYALPGDATWVGRVWTTHQAKEHAGEVTFLPGGSVFASKRTFTAIGGFPEDLQTAEDVEFSARARQQGRRVLAFPELAVVHLGTPRTLGHFYRQNRWHGTHVLRMFVANLPSKKNLPLVALSVYTLLLFWLTVLALPAAFYFHRMSVALIPLAGLLFPSVLLAAAKGLKGRRPQDIPALCALYMTYLLARAASVLQLSARNHR